MADESTKLTLDVTDVLKKLEQYDVKLDQIQKSYEELAKKGKIASKSFAPEGDGAVKELEDINKLKAEYVKLRTASNTLKTALKSAYDPRAIAVYTKEIKNAEVGLKKLEQTGTAVGVNLKKIGKEGSLAANVVSEAFGAITKATIILAIIDQVAKLTKEAVSLSNSFDRAQKSFNAFTGNADKAARLVNDLTGVANRNILDPEQVFKAGQSLLAFGEAADRLPATLERIALIGRATGKDFNELALIYGKARTSGVLYAEDINQLVEAGVPIIQEFAKQLGVSTGEVKKLASEGKISFEELQLAFFNLSKEGSQFSKLAQEQADTLPALYQSTVNKLKPLLRDIGDFISDIAKEALRSINAVIDLVAGTDSVASVNPDLIDKAALDEDRRQYEEFLKLEQAAIDKRNESNKKNAEDEAKKQAERAKRIAELRIEAMADGQAKEIAQETARYQALLKEYRKYGIDSQEETKRYQDNIGKIKVKYFLERLEKETQALEDEKESIQRGFDELTQIQIDAENKRQDALAVNAASRKNQSELSEALFKEAELASRQVFFEKKRSDKEIDEYERNVAKARAIFQLKIQQEELQRSLDFDSKLTDAEKATLRQRIENINTEIGQISSGLGEGEKKGQPKSILELLGFPKGGAEDQALGLAVDAVKNAIDEITQKRIEAAEEQRRIADEGVSKAEQALEDELQLQRDGYASNVDLRKKDLEDAKKSQAIAIEEQRKAARQKALIDAATQVSSLITAGAQLFAAHSGIPFVGIALAIAGIATMLATISRLKSTARGATQFRTGGGGWLSDDGFIHGKSHAEGGNLLEVERGELMQLGQDGSRKRLSVVRREKVGEYFDLLDAANRGDKKALARHAFELSGGGEVDRGAIAKRVFGSVPSSSKGSSENLRPILERMLQVMTTEKKREEFDPINKIKRKGNTTTYYR
jgi:tape measure domain-containing protein